MTSGNRLSTKIIMMVEVIILISSMLFCAVSVYRARSDIRKAIQQRMLDIANCASGSVNGDVLESLTKEDVDSPEYKDIYKTLAVFRDNVELEYVYSIKEESEGNFIFTMDLDQVSPASYGDSVKYTEALAKAGRGIAAVDEVPYSDQWGRFYSAYSPVFDSSHKVAGIIAVDFSAQWFEEQLASQMRTTIISYVVILLISLFVAALLSFFIVRPFVRAQGKLLEEKVRAESANQAKSDFLANMSHEIRTPINAVLGMNEMILREGRKAQEIPDSDGRAVKESVKNIRVYAGDVENAGHNLLAIVNDILDFSKIEAGRMDLMDSPYQLSSILNDLSNMSLYKAQDKELEFVIDVDRNLPDELSGDEVRVRQIITNLLNNAVKYTQEGTVKLILRGEMTGEDKILLNFRVEDTGIGIKEEDIDKLFNRFERLDMERNSTVEGTGLGLVITKRLLDMMGGTISVESEYGKGSVFTVTIPQKVISDLPMGNFQEHFEKNMLDTGNYRETFRAPDAKILIVDDTKINLTVAVNLLKNTKMTIDTATSGSDAVSMAEKTAYDVILMDQRMPEMEGTEALHLIRSSEGGSSRNTPVICLTADAVVGAKERYLAEGFSGYLTKPIDSYALEKMLIKFLPQSKVEYVHEEREIPAEDSSAAEGFEDLVAVGIDPATGLKYCQDDKDFYRSLLAEYSRGYNEKTVNLNESFKDKNWHDYAIYVHALKSTSKMIGASELSDLAASLESYAEAGDSDAIRSRHDDMMRRYMEVNSAICSLIPQLKNGPDSDVTEGSSSGDDEIMEFYPE